MKITENNLYIEDVENVCNLELPWEKLKNKSVFISGASGLIGSFLIDVLMKKNLKNDLNCKIYSLSRNEKNANERFEKYLDNSLFNIVIGNVNDNLTFNINDDLDYIFHLASNTHPKAYSTEPIETIATNVIGTNNILQFAEEHNVKRVCFASTCEIYGENRGDVEKFDESYCGYIDCNTLRAGYPESKRCGEALCQAYISQKNMDIVIPRLTRAYGPTMLMSDTKALSQFIKNGIDGEDIVLKSEGTQYYSYIYVADAISALLTIILNGKCGEAYNIAYDKSDIMLKDLAQIIADYVGKKVIFKLPDEVEKAGYSKATKARLNSEKIENIGWKAKYDIEKGIKRTIDILKKCK